MDNTDLGSYLVNISKRVAALEVDIQDVEQNLDIQDDSVRVAKDTLIEDAHDIKKELIFLRSEVTDLSGDLAMMIQTFKRLARKEGLDRVNRKIELWGPEKLATRGDLNRFLGGETVEAYCVRCKNKTKMKHPHQVLMKNGMLAMKGRCFKCNCGTYRILGKP